MHSENPFNRKKSEIPLMKILVDTSSLLEKILSNDTMIVKLINMSIFPYIDICFTISDNQDINNKLEKTEVELIRVKDVSQIRYRFDYVVTGLAEATFDERNNLISADYAMELIRILLVNLGIYEIVPSYKVGVDRYMLSKKETLTRHARLDK